jgi:hypothetical protein
VYAKVLKVKTSITDHLDKVCPEWSDWRELVTPRQDLTLRPRSYVVFGAVSVLVWLGWPPLLLGLQTTGRVRDDVIWLELGDVVITLCPPLLLAWTCWARGRFVLGVGVFLLSCSVIGALVASSNPVDGPIMALVKTALAVAMWIQIVSDTNDEGDGGSDTDPPDKPVPRGGITIETLPKPGPRAPASFCSDWSCWHSTGV